MTAATLVTHLPLAVGGALGSATGRVFLWGMRRFARAPMTYLAVLAFGGLSAAAVGNALYYQPGKHPAPLFGEAGVPRAKIEEGSRPVILAPVRQEPTVLPEIDRGPETGSLPAAEARPPGASGNPDVFAIQQKLKAMNLFDGEVDGYYGPRTARAIRAFELAHGLRPLGAISPEVTDAILRAPLGESSRFEPAQQPLPAERRSDVAPEEDAVTEFAPLPELTAGGEAAVEPDAEQRFNEVADQAEGAFDALAGMLGDMRGTPESSLSARPPLSVAEAEPQMAAIGSPEVSRLIGAADPILVAQVQRGLASLGFLAGTIDGVASEGTAKAIRNFEVYHNYPVTGEVSPELIGMLKQAGAAF